MVFQSLITYIRHVVVFVVVVPVVVVVVVVVAAVVVAAAAVVVVVVVVVKSKTLLPHAKQALEGGRGIALHKGTHPQHYKGVVGQRYAPAASPLRKVPGTHCTGGLVKFGAVLDG